jgi:hypothetical protein
MQGRFTAAESYLRDFHRRHPGVTARLLDGMLLLDGTPEQLWEHFSKMYTVDLLPAEAQGRLAQRVRAACEDLLRPDGTIPCSLGLAQLTARRGTSRLPAAISDSTKSSP